MLLNIRTCKSFLKINMRWVYNTYLLYYVHVLL